MNHLLFSAVMLCFLSIMPACAENPERSTESLPSTVSNAPSTVEPATKQALSRTGLISQTELLAQYTKFNDEYASYQTDPSDLLLMQKLAGFDVIVVLGVWCHDSQREVPRLLKLLDEAKVELNSLQLIAVNKQKELPDGIDSQYSFSHTPTIFVSKNQQILAKIVEKPKQSIARDLLSQILF